MKMMEAISRSFPRLFILFYAFMVLVVVPIPTVESTRNLGEDYDVARASNAAVSNSTFDIMSFGAKGDGVSNDSDALLVAWKAACNVSGSTLLIPSHHKFLINPIILDQGPCQSNLTFQVEGTILAPPKGKSWPDSTWKWIDFKSSHNLTVQGTGIFDGQGFDWWKSKSTPSIKPAAVKFDSGSNVTVRDVTIQNSPQFHLNFNHVVGVTVDNITISSPETSPNTDGIHLQETQNVAIQDSHVDAGDDCISIQTGTKNVNISNTYCGHTHGISIGGLGKDGSFASVEDIFVDHIFINKSQNGARIKSWPGGRGSVKKVRFSNIQMEDVRIPIVIDQNYCDKNSEPNCEKKHGNDAVVITDVKFNQINGTYNCQPVNINCSDSKPCTDIGLTSVQLRPVIGLQVKDFFCANSYGITGAPLFPPTLTSCLKQLKLL